MVCEGKEFFLEEQWKLVGVLRHVPEILFPEILLLHLGSRHAWESWGEVWMFLCSMDIGLEQ